MTKNAKRAIVGLIGGLGFIFLLIGAIGHVYPTTTGVIIMFACWLIAGAIARFWGLRKEKNQRRKILEEASRSSQLGLDNFPVNNANVELSGASTGTVNLDGRLDADLSGASNLSYIGEPTLGTMNITGASTLNKK